MASVTTISGPKSGKKGAKRGKKAAKRKLSDLTVEEFFQQEQQTPSDNEVVSAGDVLNESSESDTEPKKRRSEIAEHKDEIANLKKTDPEFYQFLRSNDQDLLNFDDDESDEEGSTHEFPDTLEEATYQDSDEEIQEGATKKKSKKDLSSIKVTISMVEKWKESLKESNSLHSLLELVKAFHAAVRHTEGDDEAADTKYQVEGSQVFNAVVTACIRCVHPTLQAVLSLKEDKGNSKRFRLPSTSPKWKRVGYFVKSYLQDVVAMLGRMTEPVVEAVMLRHVHNMIPYYACFLPKLCRTALKVLIRFWSTGEETVRVLAFLGIIKLVRNLPDELLEISMKQMYMAYVQNTKFTSPGVLPSINFMQRTLAELFDLDHYLAYQHAFVFIRQLAIHLRNAIQIKKKDNYQAVYNWQYVHCLYLWCRMLHILHASQVLQPLIYPLAQVTTGVIKLAPSARFYPLRFHCIRALNILSETTGVFIPVVPFILEILDKADFNKKHSNLSFKPINFTVALKLTPKQLHERGFKDGLVEQICDLLLESLHMHCHEISFPEIALPTIAKLKEFLKKCKVANYCKQAKLVLNKVQETRDLATKRRQAATSLTLNDTAAIKSWEENNRKQGLPLIKYYATYRKLRAHEIQYAEAGKEKLIDDSIPEIDRKKFRERQKEDRKEFKELFESESEDEDDEPDGNLQEESNSEADYSDVEDDEEGDEGDEDGEEDWDEDGEDETPTGGSKKKFAVDDDKDDVVEDLELSEDEDDVSEEGEEESENSESEFSFEEFEDD